MSKKNTDHVVMQGDLFVCRHCGATYKMNLPCPINVMTAAIKAYVDTHKDCTPQEKL